MLDLTTDQLAAVRAILRSHLPGVPVRAFGSRVTGTARPHSDLDLAAMTEAPLSFGARGALAEAFSESDLPFRVDVLDWAATAEPFRAAIAPQFVAIQDG